ncbi:hypothetical protein [Echinicola rosea]|uniref:DUF3137 domain-containing protein n=1 Tax=Echinicola rosea TaxID=1807691 RepID=A0ABQ1VBQ2_9BACT|nr:hypothetical protein [Echinicola rosea]GGF48079.1 hypothetical protein GCM10011339_40810 [Echinicola rosea]
MNWRKIDDNWKSFVGDYDLKEESGENNYFYGKQELYKATEDFQGFRVYYENKFNKSAELGLSFRVGHRLTMVSLIKLDKKWRMTVERKSLWKRIFNSTDKLMVESTDRSVIGIIPLEKIEKVTSYLPDLKLSIKEFDRYQNEQIPFGQTVLMIESKYQPQELEQLTKPRELMTFILEKLKMNNKIKPVNDN